MNKLFLLFLCGFLSLSSPPAYAGGKIFLKVGANPGGGIDAVGRLIARHIGRFLPGNPSISVHNIPGSASLKLVKMMMGSEPADGSVLALVNASTGIESILDPKKADFDAGKIKWIGALDKQIQYCYTGANSKIETTNEFLSKSFKVGATSRSGETYKAAALIKKLFNPSIEIIIGFRGTSGIDVAIARGEIAGMCGRTRASLMMLDLLDSVHLAGLLDISDSREVGNVPNFFAMLTEDIDRRAVRLLFGAQKIQHPLMLPPDTPDDVVDRYRSAFDSMVRDKAFLDDARMLNLGIDPTSGAETEKIFNELISADGSVIGRAKEIIQ